MPDDVAEACLVEITTAKVYSGPISVWLAACWRQRLGILLDWHNALVVISACVLFAAISVELGIGAGGLVNCIDCIALIGCAHPLVLPYLLACSIAGCGHEDGSGLSLKWHIVFCMVLAPYLAVLMLLVWRRFRSP